ncbi:MAG: Autotransporter-associated beta strand repeat-containing protein, partial [Verrucomicrobia bacterium]
QNFSPYTGTIGSGGTMITMGTVAGLAVGMPISLSGILPAGTFTFITSIDADGASVGISQPAIADQLTAGTFTTWSTLRLNGDITASSSNASSVSSLSSTGSVLDLNGANRVFNIAPVTVNSNTALAPITPTLNVSAAITDQWTSGTFTGSSGGYGLTKTGNGLLQLSAGSSSFSGGMNVLAGGLIIGGSSAGNAVGATVTAGPVGTGVLAMGSLTTLITSGSYALANNYTLAGTLSFKGLNTLTLNGSGSLSKTAFSTINVEAPQATLTLGGILSDTSGGTGLLAAGLTKSGLGTLALLNSNTFTGGIQLNAGTLLLGGPAGSSVSPLPSYTSTPTSTITLNSGLLQLLNNGPSSGSIISYADTALVSGTSASAVSLQIGPYSANTANTIEVGSLTMTGGQILNVLGSSNYSLRIDNLDSSGTAAVRINPSSGTTVAVYNFTGAKPLNIGLGSLIFPNIVSLLSVTDRTTQTEAFGVSESWGLLDGSGNLLETGAGKVLLTGAGTSNFSGGITLNGGALVVTGTGQLGAATNTVGVTGVGTTGGMLVIDGGKSGLTLQQSLSVSGRGPTPMASNVALLSIGNNTFTGALQLGNQASRADLGAAYGNTTFSGPINLGTTAPYFTGSGNVILSGSISSATAVSWNKNTTSLSSGLWLQNVNNTFSGSLTINSSTFARVEDGRALGKGAIQVNLGVGGLELRADAPTLGSFSSVNTFFNGYSGTVFADRAVGGVGLAQNLAMGRFSFTTVSSAGCLSLNLLSRDGYGITIGTLGGSFGVFSYNTAAGQPISFTNKTNGTSTLNGNVTLGFATPLLNYANNALLTISANGDTVWNGDLLTSGSISTGFLDGFNKSGSGLLQMNGTASTYFGTTTVSDGILQVGSLEAINNSGAVNGSLGLDGGGFSFSGATSETTNKLVNLSGSGNGLLLANGSGSATVTFAGGLTAGSLGAKSLVLGGTNTAANTLSEMISNGTNAVVSLFKADSGTWVYAPSTTATLSPPTGIMGTGTFNVGTLRVNTSTGITVGMSVSGGAGLPSAVVTAVSGNTIWLSNNLTSALNNTALTFGSLSTFTGAISISGGSFKIKNAQITAVNVISDQSPVAFVADNAAPGLGRQTAGGRFEYSAYSGTTENVGTLSASAGQGVVSINHWAGSLPPVLAFSSLGARSAGATVDFSPVDGIINILSGGTNVNGLLGAGISGWAATFKGVDFATLTGQSVDSYASYTPFGGATLGGTLNYLLSSGSSTSTAQTLNSLKLTGAGTLTLGGTLSLNSGALLFDNSTGAKTIAHNGTLTNTLGAANKELIVITNGTAPTNALTLSALLGSGAASLTKAGSGLLILSGSNTYTGNTVLNGGTLRLSGGSASIGLPGASNSLTLRQDATFDVNGAGLSSSLYTGGTLTLSTVGILSGAGNLDNTAPGASALSLGSSSTAATGVFTGVISNSSGTLTVVRNGASGTQYLTGLNTYTGATVLSGGATLAVTSLANGGTASGIGASSNAAANLVFNGGILQYTGSTPYFTQFTQTPSVATDRLFTLAGNATLDSSGNYGNNDLAAASQNNATLVFSNTGSLAFTGTGTRTLTLTGNSTGDNEIALKLVNNGTAALSVTKSGTGQWLLSGTNTYSGTTTVSAGILQAQDGIGLSPNSNLTLNGGVFQSSGTFTRALGTTAGKVQFGSSGGGFAASGTGLKVNLGGSLTLGTAPAAG